MFRRLRFLFQWGGDYLSVLNLALLLSFFCFVYFGLNLYIGVTLYLPVFLLCILRFASKDKSTRVGWLDCVVLIFVALNLISGLGVFFGGLDASSFLKSVPYIVFPIFLYYYCSLAPEGRDLERGFFLPFVFWLLFSIVFGFYFQVFPDDAYVRFIVEINGEGYLAEGSAIPRMYSYFYSSVVGAISALGVPALFYMHSIDRRVPLHVGLAVLAVGCALSLARVSWVVFLFEYIICVILFKRYGQLVLLLVLVPLLIFLVPNLVGDNIYFEIIRSKFEGGAQIAFDERLLQYDFANNYIAQHPFGGGLGAFGHKSVLPNEERITDANYHRIFAELGWLGGLIFFGLLASFAIACFRRIRVDDFYVCAFGMLAGFMVVGVGTNIFDYNYSSNVFWALCGVVSWRLKRDARDRSVDLGVRRSASP